MIRNLHTDPHCYKPRKVWDSQARANDDKWRYELATGQTVGGVLCWSPLDTSDLAGHVLFARLLSGVQAVFDDLHIEYGTTIAKRDGWIAATIANNVSGSIMIRTVNGPFILENVGVYTPSDWDKIHDLYTAGILPYPWIEGEYLPLGGGGTPLAVSMPIHILIARCAHDYEPLHRSVCTPRRHRVECPCNGCFGWNGDVQCERRGHWRRPSELPYQQLLLGTWNRLRHSRDIRGERQIFVAVQRSAGTSGIRQHPRQHPLCSRQDNEAATGLQILDRELCGRGQTALGGELYAGRVDADQTAIRNGDTDCPIVRWGHVTPMTSISQWEVAA